MPDCRIQPGAYESPFKAATLQTSTSMKRGLGEDGKLLDFVSSLKFGSLKIGSLKAVTLHTGTLKTGALPYGMDKDGKFVKWLDPFVGGGSLTYGMAPDGSLLRGTNPLGGTWGVSGGKVVIAANPFSGSYVGGGGRDVSLQTHKLQTGSMKVVSLKPGAKNAAPVGTGFHGSPLLIGSMKTGTLNDETTPVSRGRAGNKLKSTTLTPGRVR